MYNLYEKVAGKRDDTSSRNAHSDVGRFGNALASVLANAPTMADDARFYWNWFIEPHYARLRHSVGETYQRQFRHIKSLLQLFSRK